MQYRVKMYAVLNQNPSAFLMNILACFRISLLMALICATRATFAHPGEIDLSFNAGAGAQYESGATAIVFAAGLQADGKVVLAGDFTRFNGAARNYIVRLNRNGSVDNSFSGSLTAPVSTLSILPDGKILIAALDRSVAEGASIARLNDNGSLDASFKVRLMRRPDQGYLVQSMLALSDGRIVIAGSFTNVNETACSKVALLKPDGNLDLTFRPGSAIQDDAASALAVLPDGSLLVGGSNVSGGERRAHVVRLSMDGTLDPSFAPSFHDPVAKQPSSVLVLRVAADGNILVGGRFTYVDSEARSTLARLKTDGSLAPGFALPFQPFPSFNSLALIGGMELQSDGKLLISGRIQLPGAVAYQAVLRLNADGTLDRNFYSGSGATILFSGESETLLQPDGAIIFAGGFTDYDGVQVNGIVRIQGGEATSPRIIVQPLSQTQPVGSRVVLSATVLGAAPLNYQWHRNGVPISGATEAALVLDDVRVNQSGDYSVVARNSHGEAASQSVTLTVLNSSGVPGSVDGAFDAQINGPVNQLAVAPDGKILIAGGFTVVGGQPRNGLARLFANGNLDQSFSPTNGPNGLVALGTMEDQRVLLATSRYPTLGIPPNLLIVLSPLGIVEATLDFETILKAAGFQTDSYYQETKFFVQPDGTAVVRQYGPAGTTYKTGYFALRLNGNVLTATPTTITPDPSVPRQSAGKLVTTETESLGGNGVTSYVLLRRDEGGTIDPSFRLVLGQTTRPQIAGQMDDQLLVIATPVSFGPFVTPQDTVLRRLRRDGTPDTTFPALVFGRSTTFFTPIVSSIVVLPGNRVLVAGAFSSVGGVSRSFLARIDLGLPQSPAPPLLIDGPESKDVLPGQGAIFKVNPDAAGPLEFQWLFRGNPLIGQTNATLVLTNASTAEGDYSIEVKNAAGSVRSTPARLTVVPAPGGTVDPSFDPGSGAEDGQVNALLLEPDGRILVGGTFTRFNGQPRQGLVRLNADGKVDASFDAGRRSTNSASVARLTVEALARTSSGRILFGGLLAQIGEAARTNIFRLNPDGTLDGRFQAAPAHPPTIMSLAVLPDESVLFGGTFNYTNQRGIFFGDSFRNLVRLTPDGKLDTAYQPQVSASQSGSFPVSWFLPGNVRAMAHWGEKRLLVAGAFEPRGLGSSFARLNENGSRDNAFEPRIYESTDQLGRGGVPTVTSMALDPRGDSAIAGGFSLAGAGGTRIARFTETGRLTGLAQVIPFASGFAFNALAFQQDGKLIVGGSFSALGSVSRTNLIRLHRDGSVDGSFGRAAAGPNGKVSAIVVEPSGAILIGGGFTSVDGMARGGIARLYNSGTVYRELLRPQFQQSTFSASVHTLPGKRYVLERSNSLVSPTWSTAAALDGDGSVKTFSNTTFNSTQQFYRLRIE
jgi:uncharacterized delta-60 repeat protein